VALIGLANALIAQGLERRQAGAKTLRYADFLYEPAAQTALLYPANAPMGTPENTLQPAIIGLDEGPGLRLEFDWVSSEQAQFRAKLIHCNADWTPSVLNPVEYLAEFNDFPLYDTRLSQNTKVPYWHYWLEVPKPRVSGNFVLLVYRGRSERDLILTRRFVVYQNRVQVGAKVAFAQNVRYRDTHQQVELDVNYGAYPILSPKEDLKVVVRQNFRWDRALTNLKPFMVREADRRLEYRFFEGENVFPGGNEFHVFDTRSQQLKGFNVSRIDRQPSATAVVLNYDIPQVGRAYLQSEDFDGRFVIDNRDLPDAPFSADYLPVTFTLRSAEREDNRPVYVVGGFNDFGLTDANRMTYLPDLGAYQVTLSLKQGVYNYLYATENPATKTADETPIEGSHSVTQNRYDVLIYHRPPGARADQVVGYRSFRN
jgi:hypothetical protein